MLRWRLIASPGDTPVPCTGGHRGGGAEWQPAGSCQVSLAPWMGSWVTVVLSGQGQRGGPTPADRGRQRASAGRRVHTAGEALVKAACLPAPGSAEARSQDPTGSVLWEAPRAGPAKAWPPNVRPVLPPPLTSVPPIPRRCHASGWPREHTLAQGKKQMHRSNLVLNN